ncbi:hypothetical protein BDR26DRAFT_839637 [Obelidium mucronatum]|nr:hypothetical protein BDR26DRAFT_839637 [Obelidium mucronatum]
MIVSEAGSTESLAVSSQETLVDQDNSKDGDGGKRVGGRRMKRKVVSTASSDSEYSGPELDNESQGEIHEDSEDDDVGDSDVPQQNPDRAAPSPSTSGSTKKGFICSFCNKSFVKNAKLKLHLLSHTGEKPFKCTHSGCNKAYSRKNHLDVHMLSHGGSIEARKPFKCTFGSYSTNDQQESDQEVSQDDDDDAKSLTSTVSRLVRNGSDVVEGRCTARFSSLYHLNRHMKSHTDPLPHKCTFEGCNYSFAKQVQLKKHETTHTGLLPYKCTHDGCEKRFPKTSAMLEHVAKSHSKESRYLCGQPNCKASFPKWSLLQAHIKQDHKVICKQCNKTFTTKYSLQMHLKTHLLEDRTVFACTVEDCGKVFMTNSNLKTHIRTKHELLKPYKCNADGCTSEFGHKHLLTRHMRLHITVPELAPTTTTTDNNKKRRKSSNAQHENFVDGSEIATITGEPSWLLSDKDKQISCPHPGCHARFSREYDLNRHLDSGLHTGAVPMDGGVSSVSAFGKSVSLECRVLGCHRLFATDELLQRHLEDVHQVGGGF